MGKTRALTAIEIWSKKFIVDKNNKLYEVVGGYTEQKRDCVIIRDLSISLEVHASTVLVEYIIREGFTFKDGNKLTVEEEK